MCIRDRTTPHITGYVVPLDPETGGLNCRRWIGEKKQLRDQQTAYALAVEHLGLQRGVRGSTATHEAVRRVYGAINGQQQDVKVPVPPKMTMSPEAWAKEASTQMLKDLEPTFARAAFADTERTRRKGAEAQTSRERGRADRAEADRDRQKAVADRMRALPISDVLDALGLVPDPKDKAKWTGDGYIISAGQKEKAGKWFDHASDCGRGGAIDLVAHVLKTDFKGALSWLASHFGEAEATAVLSAAELEIPPLLHSLPKLPPRRAEAPPPGSPRGRRGLAPIRPPARCSGDTP